MTTLTLHHEQALVTGDGLTGLLAAQALTRFFQQVVVIKQPPAVGPPYLLNGRDQAELDELFPGLLAELVRVGATRFNLGLHVAWSVNGRWRPRYRSAYDPVVCQPDLLLAALRKRLVEKTAVKFQSEATTASLIIETTGQTNPTHTTPALLTGASRLYQWPAGYQTSWQMLIIEPDESAAVPRRGAVVLPIAAGQFYLALWGTTADPPPLDEAAFLAFARSLPNPDLAELLTQAEPLTAVMRLPTANWSIRTGPDADRVQLPLPGYLPNPLLGQPMSHALAVQAALTDSLIEEQESDPLLVPGNGRFQRHLVRHLARHLRPTNQLMQAEARRWAGLNTDRGDLAPYLARVTAGSLHSAPLLETLYAVQQGLAPPTRLFEPDVVLQTMG
jgi:hypothetical protein